jgi:hypothetical protein
MPARKVPLLLRLSEELKQKVANLAKREHRSTNQQIEFILEGFFAQLAMNTPEEKSERHKGQPGSAKR